MSRAFRKRHAKRRPAKRGRKGGRRSRVPRSLMPRHQSASIVESYEIQNIPSNALNVNYFSLNQFERAQVVAQSFKWYKASKVIWSLEPMYNVFQGTTGQTAVPYVYTVMNRTGDRTTLNVNDFLACGARPHKLTNVKKITYRPNWCSPGLLTVNQVPIAGQFGGAVQAIYQNGLKPEYGWLASPNLATTSASTNSSQFVPSINLNGTGNNGNAAPVVTPATVAYQGHTMYIEQLNGNGLVMCKLTCTVHWVFKDPKYTLGTSRSDIFIQDTSGNYLPGEVITTSL